MSKKIEATNEPDVKSGGKRERDRVPRSALGELVDRPPDYDAVGRLEWQGSTRLADLVPLRYQRMTQDPLSFYRGGALLMADDLARGTSTTIEVRICGDAHLSNFNLFSSPERRTVFDVNDFDETSVGPFEWDLKRLVASLAIASSVLGHSGRYQTRIAQSAAREYRESMGRFATQTRLEVWYATLDVEEVTADLRGFFTVDESRLVDEVVSGVKAESTAQAYEKLLTRDDGEIRIATKAPLLVPLDQLVHPQYLTREQVEEVIAGAASTLTSERQELLGQFSTVDAARKVVGVGSVGMECYIALLQGRDSNDPFFLQLKQATESVIQVALGRPPRMVPGERVVEGQRLMQVTPDAFLSWHQLTTSGGPRHYYVRQLYDNKVAIDVAKLDEDSLDAYGRLCAWVLARAHARSGRSAQIAGYLGSATTADEAFARFAIAYRDRNEADYQSLRDAAKSGRVTVAQ